MFYISNYREGHACNSSSAHSVLLLSADDTTEERDTYGPFSWDEFFLKSEAAKNCYVAAQFAEVMSRKLDDELYKPMIERLSQFFGIPLEQQEWNYVDGQSAWDMPLTGPFGSKDLWIDEQYAIELVEYLSDPRIAIHGGNDNSPKELSPNGQEIAARWVARWRGRALRARKDQGYWTMYEPDSGTKVRLTFDPSLPEPKRASFPELVDMSITDWCDKGCSYCYRGSTEKGDHASVSRIHSILRALAKKEVFEIAFGGGEPMSHPHFWDIIETTHSLGITPNFTTRRTDWLESEKLTKRFYDTCGAVAFSIDSVSEMERIHALLQSRESDALRGLMYKVCFQVVVGAVREKSLRKIFRYAMDSELKLTLLGYKTSGRGGSYIPEQPEQDWIQTFEEERMNSSTKYGRMQVDTILADKYFSRLNDLTRGRFSLTGCTRDGIYSGFIDAVSGTMHLNSYEPELPCMSLFTDFGPETSVEEVELAWRELEHVLDSRESTKKSLPILR